MFLRRMITQPLGWKYVLRPLFSAHRTCSSVTQQFLHQVDPYASIRITCNYNLKIIPYDLLDCPDGNLLRATVHSEDDRHALEIDVNDKEVTVCNRHRCDDDKPVHCTLEVPIKADFVIENGGSTSLADLYSDRVVVSSISGDISTKNMRSASITLRNVDGNIACGGLTLAEFVNVTTVGKGDILLDKIQGDHLLASSNRGKITINSSYSNSSTFNTGDGNLELKNVHKLCTVQSSGPGDFVMNGFYGTLQASVASRNVQLQLSEAVGHCFVKAPQATSMELSIANPVCESALVTIQCKRIDTDDSLADQPLKNDGPVVKLGVDGTDNTLLIETDGVVKLKKMSWADMFSRTTKTA